MRDAFETDVAIVGAGIAGIGLAAALAATHRVLVLEQESRPAYHSTGRSAAIYLRNYGNDVIRTLNNASAPFFETPDAALFAHPLIRQRGALFATNETGLAAHQALLDKADGLQPIYADEAVRRFPILRREWIAAAAYEPDAQDIDVNALHEGWLRSARQAGMTLWTDAPLMHAERKGGRWRIRTAKGEVSAGILVNAAGAWADRVAQVCGVEALGIQPMRRSIAVLRAPEGMDISDWPLADDSGEGWYCKPDAGKLYVSPSEEIPVEPHDAYVDDIVLAEGLERFAQATTYEITSVERSWAGLRSFAPDRTPVAGYDKTSDGFFWLAGQGGYGIQTSPALSRLAAALLRHEEPEKAVQHIIAPLSPNRFR